MDARSGRPRRQTVVLASLCVVLAAVFCALGVWQMKRLSWKTALIERVQDRVHGAPSAPPGPGTWSGITRESDEYRRVVVRGVFLNDRETLVQAVTSLGGGAWVLTPLRTNRGFTVLVNRGFVPPNYRAASTRRAWTPQGEQQIVGLLRLSEPHGGFLRANDPAAGRWRSRDVAAIASRQKLTDVAPYFIDAEAGPDTSAWPRGGLTVVTFPNSHLAYAITWFGMALGAAWGAGLVFRERRAHEGA